MAGFSLSSEVATGWLHDHRINQGLLQTDCVFLRRKYNLLVLEKTSILFCGLCESPRNKVGDVRTFSPALCVSLHACPGWSFMPSGSSDCPLWEGPVLGSSELKGPRPPGSMLNPTPFLQAQKEVEGNCLPPPILSWDFGDRWVRVSSLAMLLLV